MKCKKAPNKLVCPLDLAENFNKARFKKWADAEGKKLKDARIARAEEALRALKA